MSDLLLRNIRPYAAEACDLLIRGGRIAGIGRFEPEPGMPVEDGGGAIAIPGLIDAHTHLDKTTWGMPWHVNNRRAVLRERIDFERENRTAIGIDPHRQSMRHAIGLAAHGATHIRSHVDIDPTHGLSLVDGVMETREKLAGIIDIEIVAFPQSGVMVMPGTVELLDAALAQGCEVLGGIDPCGIDRDPKGQLDALFALAVKHRKPIDIHLHEAGDLGAFTMELIFERIRANGMQGQVAISHAFALGMNDHLRTGQLIERIAELDIAILTTGAPSATVPSIMRLKQAGVRVGAGCDGIRDTWGPWGQPDMLDRARVVGMKNGLRQDHELEHVLHVVSQGGADVMRLEGYGLRQGDRADLTLLAGETLAHAVVEVAPRPLVVKGGRVTARQGRAVVDMP
ncbi:amidohydrolase family protein [Inquilinus limosus]|uniref:Cytosine deaminase n=1 Tax=Inquilinus limosus TaxID=171674 RepID=A0A211ZSJ3_9PROT|nr:amidohydrolase family protein [Inquilinus limosus]OWJ68174.1 cytosine deaminase [Inquilinus limosus]